MLPERTRFTIIDRKVKRKTIAHVKKVDWDFVKNQVKSKAQNADRINSFLNSEFAKAERELYDVKEGRKFAIKTPA